MRTKRARVKPVLRREWILLVVYYIIVAVCAYYICH
jgi:hypothetical protein